MARIEYISGVTGSFQEAHGSDNRLNVSARADNRAYYNSRDQGQSYALQWSHLGATDAEESWYIKNENTTLTLVVSSFTVSCDTAARFTFSLTNAVATNGTAIIPTNLNASSPHAAVGTFLHSIGGTAITVTPGLAIELFHTVANARLLIELGDRVRLGQNDACVLQATEDHATTSDSGGMILFYYE